MFTVAPSLSTPLPSTATACATGDGLSIVIVTLPALALSVVLSNLSWPLGSAASLSLLDAPPPDALPPPEPLVLGGGVWAAVVVSLEEPPELELSSLPHPATAKAATAAQSAAAGVTFSFIGLSSVVGSGFTYGRPCRRWFESLSPARILDLSGHHALARLRGRREPLALHAQAVVLARNGCRSEVHVCAAGGVGAERAGADLHAVVAHAPELVDAVGLAAQAAHAEAHLRAGGHHPQLRGGVRGRYRRRPAEARVVDVAAGGVGAARQDDHAGSDRRGGQGAGERGRERASQLAAGGRAEAGEPAPGRASGCGGGVWRELTGLRRVGGLRGGRVRLRRLAGEAVEHGLLERGRRLLRERLGAAGDVEQGRQADELAVLGRAGIAGREVAPDGLYLVDLERVEDVAAEEGAALGAPCVLGHGPTPISSRASRRPLRA